MPVRVGTDSLCLWRQLFVIAIVAASSAAATASADAVDYQREPGRG